MKTLFEKVSEIGPIISQYIDEDEINRRISKPVLQTLREAGFLRLFLPKSLGGIEADPITAAKVVEEVARYNTAAGWSMMVANVSTWWCNRLSEKGIEEIYKHGPDTFIAGVFHPPMKATPVQGGYSINGRSPLTSNVHEAQWVFVTAFVMEQSQIKMHNGIPEVIGVFMDSSDCEIIDTWHTFGMKATDSNDVAANDVFVPSHRSYPLAPEFEPNSHYTNPLYQFPAIGASIASLIAPVALAVARNAIEELKTLAEKKVPFGSAVSIRERGSVQKKLGMAEAFVQSSRAYLFQTIAECWSKTVAGERLTLEERAGLLLAVTHTNQTCVQAVDLMYSAAGSSGIYIRNKLAHYFTDAQVIRQHGFSNDSRYETAAQIYFGLQPDLPVIIF
ncbi:MAG TPA: acyl-CoA dehydrogenase family protein [Flavitalea sp.]|nr:acyl-CoA dehydrogenase family protein [Flavitalea sp.]HTF28688.1 acyl-CoA dehydrogenase family protein [Flavitalea sp.]